MKPLRVPPGENLRLRPRDGEPRCIIEEAAQFLWRWRIEGMLAYIVVATSLAIVLAVR